MCSCKYIQSLREKDIQWKGEMLHESGYDNCSSTRAIVPAFTTVLYKFVHRASPAKLVKPQMCLHQKKLYLLLRARSSTLNAKFGNAVTSVRWEREREREREFIGTNIKQFHANIKSWRWDTDKKLANQVVSSGAPRNFHKFLSWFKVDGRISANLKRLYFWRGCSLLDVQHSCVGVPGRNRHLSLFAQFRKKLKMAEKV